MKITYNELLGEYGLLCDAQPKEVKEAIKAGELCKGDLEMQTVMEYLSQEETQYSTYTHN